MSISLVCVLYSSLLTRWCRPVSLKRLSHGKIKLANSCWQTQVGVCERRKNSRQTRSICRQQFANVFANCFCVVHTHQLEFANTSASTLVCRVKAALRYLRALPTICVHPELDGRTLDIVHSLNKQSQSKQCFDKRHYIFYGSWNYTWEVKRQ